MVMDFMELQGLLRNSVFVLLFACNCSCSDEVNFIESNNKSLEKLKGKYYLNGDLFSGFVFELVQNGDTSFVLSIKDGFKNGQAKYFWPNGNLKRWANFKEGNYHGEVIEYYENGQVYSKFNYVNGHESGLQQVWKSDGRIKVNYEVIDGRKYGLTGVKNCVNVLEDSFSHF